MKKILEYALSTKDVKEIAGTFAVENFGSRRVMEKQQNICQLQLMQ